MGGGLVDFYLIHVFYNLLFLIGKFKIKNINLKKRKNYDPIRNKFGY